MDTLTIFIHEHADVQMLPLKHQLEAVKRFGVTFAKVEEIALERNILPARYQRNLQTLSVSDQLTLFRSSVGVIGCGGLGGYIVEELARLGIGKIVVVDPDVFEEHNLNRQLFSTFSNLGRAKVAAAASRIEEINPAVTLIPIQTAFSSENGASLLDGCHVVVDALDSIKVRLELSAVCTSMNIPLVHGAVAGWFGHVATKLPDDNTLQAIYRCTETAKGVEQSLGNLSFTPALIASLEVAEVCKLLVGQGKPLSGRQLLIDLISMEINVINIF